MNLFDIIVDEKELHPNFVNVKRDPYKVEVLEEWGKSDLLLHDGNGKFIKEFQTTFNSAFWELYCYKVFEIMGAKFNFEHEHPDFLIELNGEKLAVECTIANNAKDAPPESDFKEHMKYEVNLEEIVYKQTLRLSNAFCGKVKKYKEKYCKKGWVKDIPFVIALEPFDQANFMFTGTESIRTLLYGWKIERETHDEYSVESIEKSKESNIKMGLFLEPEYSDISGVLFSNTATIGKVDAIGNNPDLTFGQIRYNVNYDRPQASFDSRLKQTKTDLRCQAIKKATELPQNAYKKYTIRRPYLIWEQKYTEDITDGLILFINPYSNKPISENIIKIMKDRGVNIVTYDVEKNEDVWDVHDGSLIQRKVFNFTSRNTY